MEPNVPSTSLPTNPAPEPLVEFVRSQRQNAGAILAILAVLFLGSTVFLFIQANREPKSLDKKTEKLNIEKEAEPDADSKLNPETVNPKRTDYMLGAILALFASLATGTIALWLIGGLPHPDEAGQRTVARMQILATSGILGLILMAAGAVYFYQWVDSLGNAFEKGKEKELTWVVVPLLLVLAGAALMMAGVQPARAEERNNPSIRRLVYGSNLALTSMLLLVVLIVGNVIISFRVSSTFDTTESGFYSMSDQTKEFLGSLDQTILAYAILPGQNSRQENDLLGVLNQFSEASRDKFKVIFVSAITNSLELSALKIDYPPVQDGAWGVLLTFASDKKRFSFIPWDDFFNSSERNPMDPTERPKRTFVGEGRLVKELLFLADNKQKPKVYFTQSAEEMQLTGQDDPSRAISTLQSYLEKNYLDVKPLMFDKDNPKVPEDCTVLVVADPQMAMPEKQAEAIKKYMTEPLHGGRKGKLVVLAGAPFDPRRARRPDKTGLEDLLKSFNVILGQKYVLAISRDRSIDPYSPLVVLSPESMKPGARHPLATILGGVSFQMLFPRSVSVSATPAPTFTATKLLVTASEGGAWEEDELPRDFGKSMVAASQEGRLFRSLPVGVVVSEGTTGRLAVIGDGVFLCNAAAQAFNPDNPPAFDLMGGIVDWLRDRPPVPSGVQTKTYAVYTMTNAKTVDKTRLEYLPLGLVLLVVAGIGMGVWITRRQQA